jgi:DNA polymerase III subunit delta
LSTAATKNFTGNEDIIILHGDDMMAVNEWILRIVNDAEGFAELNTSRVNAKESNRTDIIMQMRMLPLGSGKRKVIVDYAQEILKTKNDQKWLDMVLQEIPPSTQLILVLHDEKKYQRGQIDWVNFPKSHWSRKALNEFSGANIWQELPLPDVKTMPQWIENKAKSMGGNFHPSAAQTLATLVGSDLFQAQQEINKAISYVGQGKQVKPEEIRLLCTTSKEEDMYALVDAVGQRDGKTATRLYQTLRIDIPAQVLFSMLVRQIRLLLQTRFIIDKRGPLNEVTEMCDLKSEWLAKKMINQAKRFDTSELEMVYRQLDWIDKESKIGNVSIDAAIETFLVKVTNR